jgi:hypothetical protein
MARTFCCLDELAAGFDGDEERDGVLTRRALPAEIGFLAAERLGFAVA